MYGRTIKYDKCQVISFLSIFYIIYLFHYLCCNLFLQIYLTVSAYRFIGYHKYKLLDFYDNKIDF